MAKFVILIIFSLILLNAPSCSADPGEDDVEVSDVEGKTDKPTGNAEKKIEALINQWAHGKNWCTAMIGWSLMAAAAIELAPEGSSSSSSSMSLQEGDDDDDDDDDKEEDSSTDLQSKLSTAESDEDANLERIEETEQSLVETEQSQDETEDGAAFLQVQERRRADMKSALPYLGYMTGWYGQMQILFLEELIGIKFMPTMTEYFSTDTPTLAASKKALTYYLLKQKLKFGFMWRGISLVGPTEAILQASGKEVATKAEGLGNAIAITRYWFIYNGYVANMLNIGDMYQRAISSPGDKLAMSKLMSTYSSIMGQICHFWHIAITAPAGLLSWEVPAEWKVFANYLKYAFGAWAWVKAGWDEAALADGKKWGLSN